MKPNPEIGQGRNGDAPAPELSPLVLKFAGCIVVAVLLYLAGLWWGEWKFAAGSILGGAFVFVMGCFAVEWV
jgi:hypothetical protein